MFCRSPPPTRLTEAQRSSSAAKGAWPVSDESTAALQGQLERAFTGAVALAAVQLADKLVAELDQ